MSGENEGKSVLTVWVENAPNINWQLREGFTQNLQQTNMIIQRLSKTRRHEKRDDEK